MKISQLNSQEIIQLRHEIVLNSLYIDDYQNSFDIPPEQVCNFFDAYVEYLEDLASGDVFDNTTRCDWRLFDTDDNLEEYFNTIEWGD